MSRTYKDYPSRVKRDAWDKDIIRLEGWWFRYIMMPTTKTKKRKEMDTEDHWMSTPSSWTRIMMNRPQRRNGSLWERKAVRTNILNLLELDTPSVGRKPHQYYW